MIDRATLTRRSFVVGAMAGGTALTAYAATPRKEEHRLAKTKLGALIPVAIGPWRYINADGVVVARAEEDIPTDGYDQLVTRTYEAPGRPSVMLLLAYGSTQGGSLQLHRPETCYPGQGFLLSEFDDLDLRFAGVGPVHTRRFTARRDDRIERLIYWTRIGADFPRNTAQEYRAILARVLAGVVPDGILVRMSTIGSNLRESDGALVEFASAMVAALSQGGRHILLGDTIAAEIAGTAAIPTR